MTWELVNPEGLPAPRGFNHGMLAPAGGRVLFVAGQEAAAADGTIDPGLGIVEQFGLALESIAAVLGEAGGGPEHVGRLTIYVTDIADYRSNLKPLGEEYRRRMGRHYPAMALVEVGALVDPNARVEIEATAVLPPPGE